MHIFRTFVSAVLAVFAASIFTAGESRAGWVYDIEAAFDLVPYGPGQPSGSQHVVLGRIEFSTASGTDSSGVADFQFDINNVAIPIFIAYQASFRKEDLQGIAWSIDSASNLTLTTLQAIQVGAPGTPGVSACLELVFSAVNGCGPVPTTIVNGVPATDPFANTSIFGYSIFDQAHPNFPFRSTVIALDIRLVSAPLAVPAPAPAPAPLSIMLLGGALLAARSFRLRG